MRPEPVLDLILAWHHPGPGLEQARATLARAMTLAGLPPHWREQPGAPASRHLVLTLHGRRLPLPPAPEPLAALLAAPPRPRFPLALRLLLPAAGYLLLPKCPLCWAAWLALFGAAGAVSLPAATALLGLLSVAALFAPARQLLRARRSALLNLLLAALRWPRRTAP